MGNCKSKSAIAIEPPTPTPPPPPPVITSTPTPQGQTQGTAIEWFKNLKTPKINIAFFEEKPKESAMQLKVREALTKKRQEMGLHPISFQR